MKSFYLPSLIAAALIMAGCSTSKSSSSHTPTPAGQTARPATAAPVAASNFDTSKLVSSFANMDVESNKIVASVVQNVSGKNYKAAASELQKLSRIPGLTASQDSAVKQLASQLAGK
jgi:PBP1b-binding outer membrane lipoprotein LpoB